MRGKPLIFTYLKSIKTEKDQFVPIYIYYFNDITINTYCLREANMLAPSQGVSYPSMQSDELFVLGVALLMTLVKLASTQELQ